MITPDEATRGEAGAVNIASKILEKIEIADVFMADITPVTPSGAPRPCPNPNVLIELGYAVAELGWERVILLFNEAFGSLKTDLPFDIIQNRVSTYRLTPEDAKAGAPALEKLVRVAIEAVWTKDPKRPAQLRGLSPERVRHDRDVQAITWLMSQLSLPVLDKVIEDLPRYIHSEAIWFYETFQDVVTSSRFQLYDAVLRDAVERLSDGWRRAFGHAEQYHTAPSMKLHVFSSPGDAPLSERQQDAWNEIDAARQNMAEAQRDLLDHLLSNYLEVDVRKLSQEAWDAYRRQQRALEKRLSDRPKRKVRKTKPIKAAKGRG